MTPARRKVKGYERRTGKRSRAKNRVVVSIMGGHCWSCGRPFPSNRVYQAEGRICVECQGWW